MLQLSVHSEAQRTEWLWIVQVADRSGKYIYIWNIFIYMERDNPSESNPMTMAFLSRSMPAGFLLYLNSSISEQ